MGQICRAGYRFDFGYLQTGKTLYRLKILHITPWYKPAFRYGGPIFSVAALCESLQKKGTCTVNVFTTTANGLSELNTSKGSDVEVEGVKIHYFRRWTKDNSNFSPFLLWQLFFKIKNFDIIHINTWWNTVAIFSVCISIFKGIRPVISVHGMLSPYSLKGRKLIFQRLIGNWLLSRVVIHVTTEQERDEILQLNPDWKYILIPNILFFPDFKPTAVHNPSKSKFKLVFLSRIHHKKGLECLFEALTNCKSFDWELIIYGEGDSSYKDKLEKITFELGINNQIVWSGWISGEDKFEKLAHADLFVLPSHNENFAMVVLEALAVGTPVLISNQVGLKSYILEKDFGWICKPIGSDIRKKIEEAFFDSDKRKTIRKKAPESIRKDFSPSVLVNAYKDAYKRVAYGLF